jgi:hypothetical protein
VRNQQGLSAPQLQDETLMPRSIFVIGQQTLYETPVFDPAPFIVFVIAFVDVQPAALLSPSDD